MHGDLRLLASALMHKLNGAAGWWIVTFLVYVAQQICIYCLLNPVRQSLFKFNLCHVFFSASTCLTFSRSNRSFAHFILCSGKILSKIWHFKKVFQKLAQVAADSINVFSKTNAIQL